ncbi:MAG: DUF2177 family protein [Saprospiraceae bacterium]|nr:DUF2177 family protein [Saprospiraceae bacterium]
MGDYVKLYALTIPVFFAIDMLWIGLIAQKLYEGIAHLRGPVNWPAAIVFYLIFIIGILFFAVRPSLAEREWQTALLYGAAFGFFTYATYDLTNYATLKDWPLQVVIADMIWGSFLCATVALASHWMAINWLKM